MVHPYGIAITLWFFAIWHLPILWVGGSKKPVPGFPPYLNDLQRVSCLFTHSTNTWGTQHYQVKFEGSDEWIEGFEDGIWEQGIFGYRTRFNRMIGDALGYGKKGETRMLEMARFIKRRWADRYPKDPPITHVRLIRVTHRVGEMQCMALEPWTKMPLKMYPENRWTFDREFDLRPGAKQKPPPRRRR